MGPTAITVTGLKLVAVVTVSDNLVPLPFRS